jgi:hypothetical protein
MDFLILNLYLCVMCVPALLAVRSGQKWLTSSLASFFILALPEREREQRSMLAAVARVALCGLVFLYVTGAWSAFCVAVARAVASRETVTWDWLYLGVSFVWCVQVLLRALDPVILYRKVATETRAVWDQAAPTFQSAVIFSFVTGGLAVLAWIAFAVWPGLMRIPYGWALGPFVRRVDGADDFLKTNWWIIVVALSIAVAKMVHARGGGGGTEWRAWGTEIERVVFMARTLSGEWAGDGKSEFIHKLLGSWSGATAEDRGEYVLVRHPELYRYFEFHFMFGARQDAPMAFVYVRGLEDLQGLWILGQAGELAWSLKPVDGRPASHDAQRAAEMLERKFDIRRTE